MREYTERELEELAEEFDTLHSSKAMTESYVETTDAFQCLCCGSVNEAG